MHYSIIWIAEGYTATNERIIEAKSMLHALVLFELERRVEFKFLTILSCKLIQ